MEIDLGQKFVSNTLTEIITSYWERSFRAKTVKFNCSKLEWISNSEIAFFFSWIRSLEDQEILVTIQLQSSDRLKQDSDTLKKRKYCLERIMIQWRLREHISAKTTILDGGIQVNAKIISPVSNYSALPIQRFNAQTFDQDFEIVYNHYLLRFTDTIRAATRPLEISYYNSQFLDYSVFKELYSNVCLHSESKRSDDCFFSIGLNRKFPGDSRIISESRLSELSDAERIFFSDYGEYRNIDFVELTFHDFGDGIAKSLGKNYDRESKGLLQKFFGKHYNVHAKQNYDTKVIEYALLLFTSRFEIGRKIDIHKYIPRGLYILKELVKQYHGYFEVSSGKGLVGLSFKGGKTSVSFKENKGDNILFPGTRIKIVFPALDNDYNIQAESAKVVQATEEPKLEISHIHFLKEYHDVETQLVSGQTELPNDLSQRIIASFFTRMLSKIQHAANDSIIMIDFAGAAASTLDCYNKFIYFITHFPLSGNKRMVFYNVAIKGLNSTLIAREKGTLSAKGIIASTIPSIHTDQTIEWLGVDVAEDALQFSKAWKEDEDGYYSFHNLTRYNSSIVKVSKVSGQYKIELRLPDFDSVLQSIDAAVTSAIKRELDNSGVQYSSLHALNRTNYNNVSVSKDKTCYLNPRGKIVLTYVSFTEKLYIVSYRRMIATYLVYKFFRTFNPATQQVKIDKILSVTLSSQMIGHEVATLFSELQGVAAKLVALSNYYNFQNEEKFSDITPHSKVIVVNDVISTGTLTMNIIRSIELADATPVICLSIADLSGVPQIKTDVPLVSLATGSVEYIDTAPQGYKMEVINPVMNVPTSMPRTKSKENVLATMDEFFALTDERFLQIGNLKNNSVYFNYFLDTNAMLSEDRAKGYPLLNYLLSELRNKKQSAANNEIANLIRGVDIVSKNIAKGKNHKIFDRIKKDLSQMSAGNSPGLFDGYEVDVVFYPFLSNISIIEADDTPFVESKLNSFSPRIFPIPRIMTPKGWRFSFPPKFLNHFFDSNELSILILDDGSLSGDTIMQMIDSVSFLSVKSIDVLSIFGRVEDFQKELFSRIKSVQVKNGVVPITVFFGVHINIPVQNQFDSPFQTEYREILSMEHKLHNELKIELSDRFEKYLADRKQLLLDARHPATSNDFFHLFPGVTKRKVFELRDFLGMFGSYRLYMEDLPIKDIDQLIGSKNDFIAMLTVLNLEPQLYQTFKRLFREEKIQEKIRIICDDFIQDEKLMAEEWMKEFFIKSLFYLSPKWFFNSDNMVTLVKSLYKFSKNPNRESFRYIEYIILLVSLGVKNTDNAFESKSFELNIEEFISKIKDYSEDIFGEMRLCFSVFHKIKFPQKGFDDRFYINKYHHLRQYFTGAKLYENKHDDRLLPNLFSGLLRSISELVYSIENNITFDITSNRERFAFEFSKLKEKFMQEQNFGYIRDIVDNLFDFASTDLPFDIVRIQKIIRDMESTFASDQTTATVASLQRISNTLNLYTDLLLRSGSAFASYFLDATGNLMDEWVRAEKVFMRIEKNKNMLPVKRENAKNVKVNVHPYALNLAFENLLKNKRTYAEKIEWELTTTVMPEYTILTIKQDSGFEKTGDGTGQSAIKTILRGYGVQYKKISENPYTLKITFSNKMTEDERD